MLAHLLEWELASELAWELVLKLASELVLGLASELVLKLVLAWDPWLGDMLAHSLEWVLASELVLELDLGLVAQLVLELVLLVLGSSLHSNHRKKTMLSGRKFRTHHNRKKIAYIVDPQIQNISL